MPSFSVITMKNLDEICNTIHTNTKGGTNKIRTTYNQNSWSYNRNSWSYNQNSWSYNRNSLLYARNSWVFIQIFSRIQPLLMDFRLTAPAENGKVNTRERPETAQTYTFQQENGDKTAKTGCLVEV